MKWEANNINTENRGVQEEVWEREAEREDV